MVRRIREIGSHSYVSAWQPQVAYNNNNNNNNNNNKLYLHDYKQGITVLQKPLKI